MPRQQGQVAGQVPGLPGAVVVGAGQRPAAALPPLSGAAALAALQQLQQLQAAAAMAAALGQQQALAAAQAQAQQQAQAQPAANGVLATAQQVRRHMPGCDQAGSILLPFRLDHSPTWDADKLCPHVSLPIGGRCAVHGRSDTMLCVLTLVPY